MLRKFSILGLLAVVLSVSFLAGCASTNDKPYGMNGGEGTRHVNDKGRVYYTNP